MAAAALMLAAASYTSAGEPLAPGAKFPDLTAARLAGELPALADAKVVIVDFWASWCAPCKQSFPVYEKLQREYGPKGVMIVAVNVDRNVRDMEAFLRQRKPSFAVVRDAEQKLVAQVAVPAMPTAFVLDRHGIVRFVHTGFHGERSRMEYIRQLDTLLSEAP